MKVINSILQWLLVISVGGLLFFAGKFLYLNIPSISLPHINLNSVEVITLSLSLAFMWVEILKWGVTKPFNCLKCMTGWFALIIGCFCIGWTGIVYLPIGLFVGSIFSAIQMRWL